MISNDILYTILSALIKSKKYSIDKIVEYTKINYDIVYESLEYLDSQKMIFCGGDDFSLCTPQNSAIELFHRLEIKKNEREKEITSKNKWKLLWQLVSFILAIALAYITYTCFSK